MQIKIIDISLIEGNRGQIEGLPANPRIIKDAKFDALKKSIKDSPEFMRLREPIVFPMVNGKYVVIGGNQRVAACKSIGYTELHCKVLPKDTPVEKLREYTIKDNNSAGEDDWTMLKSDWKFSELNEWGFDVGEWSVPETENGTAKSKRNTVSLNWGKSKSGDVARCDMKQHDGVQTHYGSFIFTQFKRTDEGYRIDEIKADGSNAEMFADAALETINRIVGTQNHDSMAIITTPKRRHKENNFADKVASIIAEKGGFVFYPDAIKAKNKDRINPIFRQVVDIKEPMVIIYDDIITTGMTLITTGSQLPDKNKIYVVSINNN